MGTMISVPEVNAKFNQDQQYPMIPFSDRVFIPDTAIRKQLLKYCSEGLTENTLKDLLKSIHKEMADYILFSSISTENLVTISEEYIHVKKVIKLLCHTDPISGVFQFSLLEPNERKAIALLANGTSASEDSLNSIYQKMYTLDILFNSIKPNEDITCTGFVTLHPIVFPLLKRILTQLESLFSRASRKLVEYSPQSKNYYNYFPAFTTNYMLPVYENLEVESAEPCLKKFPTHKRFSPGIVAIACKHRICYGFQILRQHESTVVIYNLLMTIFREQRKVIIYDNACNLHKT
ncbi:hypothetical protein LOD99_6262 [Oopsacas minuta]|uniref:Uncharacterized protein n=1 Tax=Oopsacas minuta TaxID=111878 RepID=A0AAV7JMW0_9METZ|nr:hypothetical protein LOD99_6262 [Oopsacas minuta]